MQFLVSLVDFDRVPESYEALEFWPGNFENKGDVIVRRDVGFAETRASHSVGGVQSFSYYPYPQCNRSVHWEAQQKWALENNWTMTKVLGQFYVDTYLYHHSIQEVMKGKPWDLEQEQLNDQLCNCTLYVGGCASFETVEDSFQYNLELVHRLFDSQHPKPEQPDDIFSGRRMEILTATVRCDEVDKYLAADSATWSAVLAQQLGFVQKAVALDPATSNGTHCSLWNFIIWESLPIWKSVPGSVLAETGRAMSKAFGREVPVKSFPSSLSTYSGLTLLADSLQPQGDTMPVPTPPQVIEFNRFTLGDCTQVEKFVKADNKTWTAFLSEQPGFVRKLLLLDSSRCQIYTYTEWLSYNDWQAVCANPTVCQKVHQEFVLLFGSDPPLERLPTSEGLAIRTGKSSLNGTRTPAVGGRDVVAYFGLKPGDRDVPGSPLHRRYVNVTGILAPDIMHYHPEPYEFWFSTEQNAQLFEANPWKYIPAFGGHCTHGLATRCDMTRDLVADGRVGFTCVNSTEWVILNGTLYMNSCGMYYDFIKDPASDIAKASEVWKKWFGSDRAVGPINDKCFQDGGKWGGNVEGALIPNKCNVQ